MPIKRKIVATMSTVKSKPEAFCSWIDRVKGRFVFVGFNYRN
jgi:hypothetical protein